MAGSDDRSFVLCYTVGSSPCMRELTMLLRHKLSLQKKHPKKFPAIKSVDQIIQNTRGALAFWNLQDQPPSQVALAWNRAKSGVLASSSYPLADVIVNGDFVADTDWTKGDAAITIANGKATWSGAQAGNADLTATVAPLTNGIRYIITFILSNVTAGTIGSRLGTAVGTAQNANGTFSEEIVANGTVFLLRGNTSFAGNCEIVSVEPANPLNMDITSTTIGQPGFGSVPFAFSHDGINDFAELVAPGLTALNSIIDVGKGSIVAPVQVTNAGVWSDATTRRVMLFNGTVAGSNNITMFKTTGVNTLKCRYVAGGTTSQIDITMSLTDPFTLAMTWDTVADEVKVYLNAIQQGATINGLGTWSGTIDSASISQATQPWSGLMAYGLQVYDEVLTPSDLSTISDAMGI